MPVGVDVSQITLIAANSAIHFEFVVYTHTPLMQHFW
jgi:hypothetical protein